MKNYFREENNDQTERFGISWNHQPVFCGDSGPPKPSFGKYLQKKRPPTTRSPFWVSLSLAFSSFSSSSSLFLGLLGGTSLACWAPLSSNSDVDADELFQPRRPTIHSVNRETPNPSLTPTTPATTRTTTNSSTFNQGERQSIRR